MKKIEPNEYYTARQISLMGILPWKSPYTFNLKLNSKKGMMIFKPLIEQHEHNKTYKIRGENIIKFLADVKSGKANI